MLGIELRKLREASKLTGHQVAARLGWSHSKVSRIEKGESPLAEVDVPPLLALYGVTDAAEVRQITALARQSRQQGWWHSYGDALPNWFRAYVGFEADASVIETYEAELIPGLLQTEEYAREVIRAMSPELNAEDAERRTAARLQRQEILTGNTPPLIWAVLNESTIRRVVRSSATMRRQLAHLVTVADTSPNVTVQVLPFDAGAHASMGYSFSIMSFASLPMSIVYSEGATSATYMDKDSDVSRHKDIFGRLKRAALPPDRSVALVNRIAEEHNDA
ncbi:helix-turn-helix domain-containing protein [Streptomyces silvisoli]|uniref:Helix-turn-helix transcriptional regulator n=1 Tax=Streptomyces silvisoli TaxID=3034235 RepID=A0ABT5ZTN0_9ACTN|nr:helix-turn-helix transcriptional regulator [Streptomyces silvisoli]MDF3293188.1 helix-turn-helix transcriptional regulator [Streptomyces silvisoli]